MPYTIANPPEAVKELPAHAIEIFVAAYNSAYEQYKDRGDQREALANATAWAAVKTKYEKKDDKWVAKESTQEVSMKNDLQAKYAEILQEAGKRNKVEDTKVKAFIADCSILLGVLTPDASQIEVSIKEADEILVWLKEQASFKTEDGVQFPAAAYAYVPDPEKPSEWKLRLWEDLEKKVTRAQLGRAAAALSPGGFRGQKVEIPREDLSAVKRKIRAEYRKLDVADEDIPRWVKEAEARALLMDYISLGEATVTAKGIATIVVIRPGLNSSKERYYPQETLSRDFSVFEGVKMYADHPTDAEDKARPERSIKDWVATLKNVHVDEKGQIIGEAIVIEPWMQAKLAQLRDKKMLQEMGISINAIGTGTKGEIEGAKTTIIERIVRVRSVDFVTEPGAGGMVQMYEVDRENDIDMVNLGTLRERRPDLVKSIETEVKAVIMQEVKQKVELEERVKELETNIESLTTERDELKVKITEAEKAQRIAEAQAVIKEAVDKAELPNAAKERISERFKDAESVEGIEEAIQSEKDYIAKLAESGKVRNLGGSQPDSEADHKALVESFKRTGMTEAMAEIAAKGK